MFRILVADDNPFLRTMLRRMFEREDRYDLCAEAANGQEAIHLAIEHRPDLIILDLSMPVMNGLNASRKLKRIMPTVPIILFTQYEDVGRVLLPDGSPVDRIVSKENANQLMRHIKELNPT